MLVPFIERLVTNHSIAIFNLPQHIVTTVEHMACFKLHLVSVGTGECLAIGAKLQRRTNHLSLTVYCAEHNAVSRKHEEFYRGHEYGLSFGSYRFSGSLEWRCWSNFFFYPYKILRINWCNVSYKLPHSSLQVRNSISLFSNILRPLAQDKFDTTELTTFFTSTYVRADLNILESFPPVGKTRTFCNLSYFL